VHLTLDALSGGMLLGAAAILEGEDPRDRAVLAGVGLFEIVAALSTETRSFMETNVALGEQSDCEEMADLEAHGTGSST
jgi:hypothetical protein